MTKGELNELLGELMHACFDSGYYQATMEKCSSKLSDEDLKEYARLNREAIAIRIEVRGKILEAQS